MNGKLIVVEGLDGSGKATQTKLLCEAMKKNGKNVMAVSFPNYDSPSSALVKMYLAGEFGTEADSVNPYAASCFYAVDRFASFKTIWQSHLEGGGIVIADRYTTSNAIHQCAKLPPEQWDDFLKWLFDLEYGHIGIPAPDTVIYLRVDPDVSQELMTKRYQGHEEKKDIHEHDMDFLRRSRLAADHCAEKLGWRVVECVRDGEMRSIMDIAAEIGSIVAE
jgi:dTMP kinase